MTLFVDMDEVIADTYQAHIDLYNKKYNANLKKEDCIGSEVWQMVPEEHQHYVRNHANERGFFIDLEVMKDSQEVLRALQDKYEVYIASAAMQFKTSLEEKADWLDAHFPFIPWQNRILCGHKHILKGDILIDDRSYNLQAFDGRGIQFTSPHNVHTTGFDRADTWEDIAKMLL
ncbi:5' nucleotidase, NT5C type [Leeuwenhoekiella nanhaiensis]|uniref:5'(3')-deoxyribonucleotidase n=1 Tax=Leeuwenhoekiella nanhaiensis TaxID=1655491 RepID=A0A2G1VR33_9FLAO|nr:5'(3')-deoxyribonucleotidase [Leeuwenhoekiella nanhaiensis]PHQ29237.1 5'(3')-deoxyribonucleotidase [Leeuwenhoekiella nanhaiensis]